MVTVTKKQVQEVIEKLTAYAQELDKHYPDEHYKYIQSFKEFLIDEKVEELVKELIEREKEFKIEFLVVEAGSEKLFENELLLEWEQYKKIPKTNLTYRYDKGQGRAGMEDHIHVYLGNTKNQVYAINRSGTPHDGSKAKLSHKEIKFLRSIGFTPPENGILEFLDLDPNKVYIAYKRQLLFS